MRYYVAEVQNSQSFRRATAIEAKDLTAAKRLASRRRVYIGTVLVLGTAVDADGFITDAIARKVGGKWVRVED